MCTAVLSTTYFGPIQWYQKLHRYESCIILQDEQFLKQTYRNRCVIATANGLQALTVPVEKGERNIRNIRISDHGNWRHQHWVALESSYRQSPFFEYYADDFAPFYEKKWEFLADFNEELMALVASLLDIQKPISRTTKYEGEVQLPQPLSLYGEEHKKSSPLREGFRGGLPYYQVFASRHGFLPDLSIVDLLFNLGPEGVLWL